MHWPRKLFVPRGRRKAGCPTTLKAPDALNRGRRPRNFSNRYARFDDNNSSICTQNHLPRCGSENWRINRDDKFVMGFMSHPRPGGHLVSAKTADLPLDDREIDDAIELLWDSNDGRRRRSERSRAAIIEGCRHLISIGLDPSLAEIAAASDCSLRSIHRHFSSAKILFAECGYERVVEFRRLPVAETPSVQT